MSIYSANKTSARLLLDFASAQWGPESNNSTVESQRRFLLAYDLYIKARSYALINKSAFVLSIFAGIMVLVWPSLGVLSEGIGVHYSFIDEAIVQTTVTGLAALTFAIYSHYKKRQMITENMMRHVVYSEETVAVLIESILKEMQRIDTGFGFSEGGESKGHSEHTGH
ncbi:MAG: hypothetical protein V7707_12985 [Motiliproteus sp.]